MSVLVAMHAVIMQTVLILMVVTGVSVCQDSREMDTTVQVSHTNCLSTTRDNTSQNYFQTSMSVNYSLQSVEIMPNVSILRETTAVTASQDLLGMDTTIVKVLYACWLHSN